MIDTTKKTKIAFVTLHLEQYLTATPTVTDEQWTLLDGTFNALDRLTVDEPRARTILSDLHSFCHASQETKECIARATVAYEFTIDNHLLLLMDTSKTIDGGDATTISPQYTTDDIVGFTLSRHNRDTQHITLCMVKKGYRRQRLASAMIHSLRVSLLQKGTGIERFTVDAWPSVEAVGFFVSMGFVPARNATHASILREALTTKPEALWYDSQYAPLRNASNTSIPLVYYSTLCHTCKDASKKTQKCGQCHTVSYCCSNCQAADWPIHKLHCTPMSTIQNK